MGESEYIDLFPGKEPKDGQRDQMAYQFEDEIYTPGRSKINDYKHSSTTIQKGNASLKAGLNGEINENRTYGSGEPVKNTDKKKTYLNISDERIVWAGAIFVFFGVFVFLIGYWLGKTTMKDITFTNKQTVAVAEEKLDQKKMENSLTANLQGFLDGSKKDQATANVADKDSHAVTAVPQGSDLVAVDSKDAKDSTLTAPPVNAVKTEKTVKSEKSLTKNVKLTTTSSKKTAKTDIKTPKNAVAVSTGDNYTLQVSAHTSMDKARTIEDSLRKIGYQSYIAEASVNGMTYYRVRVGKFGNKQEAQTALAKIKSTSMGKESYILNLN
jgi:cell division septation protein DedD